MQTAILWEESTKIILEIEFKKNIFVVERNVAIRNWLEEECQDAQKRVENFLNNDLLR